MGKQKKKQEMIMIEDLTLGDEYLFEIVMQNEKLCKLFIEKFLEIPDITGINYIQTEATHKATYMGKGVRFDIYVKGQDDVAYVVELQRKDTKELEKRLRYYQSMIDTKQLGKGNNYKNLKDSYIIFICRDDFLKQGLYRYTFRNSCVEMPELMLNDGAYKVIFNTHGTKGEVSEDVKAFLRAIEGEDSDNDFVKQFQIEAEEIKTSETWKEIYMQSLLREQDIRDEGFEKGREVEKIEMAKKLLLSGISIEIIAETSGLTTEMIASLQDAQK